MRARKPWVRALLILLGWYVLFISHLLYKLTKILSVGKTADMPLRPGRSAFSAMRAGTAHSDRMLIAAGMYAVKGKFGTGPGQENGVSASSIQRLLEISKKTDPTVSAQAVNITPSTVSPASNQPRKTAITGSTYS